MGHFNFQCLVLIFLSQPLSFFAGSDLESVGIYSGPYFDIERNIEVLSVHVGTHAYLPCYVKQLGNKTVSWLRKSDGYIVSVDKFTFIADERFQVLPLGDTWTLQIKFVEPKDENFYECQVSSDPKLAFTIRLRVLVPTIWIDASEESLLLWEGSDVQVRCLIENPRDDSVGKVMWWKNGKALKADQGIFLQSKVEGQRLVSTLTFRSFGREESGNYTCYLSYVGSASISLQILNGENPAAMQTNGCPEVSLFLYWQMTSLVFPLLSWGS